MSKRPIYDTKARGHFRIYKPSPVCSDECKYRWGTFSEGRSGLVFCRYCLWDGVCSYSVLENALLRQQRVQGDLCILISIYLTFWLIYTRTDFSYKLSYLPATDKGSATPSVSHFLNCEVYAVASWSFWNSASSLMCVRSRYLAVIDWLYTYIYSRTRV